MVYITRGLLAALCELAAERDPQSVTVALTVTPASELAPAGPAADDGSTTVPARRDDVDLSALQPDADVFTDMYLPDTGGSVTAVFGMDLSTPGSAGRFISHPEGPFGLTKADDLHEVVFIAVPPYDRDAVAAFNRRGNVLTVTVVKAVPPEGSVEPLDT